EGPAFDVREHGWGPAGRLARAGEQLLGVRALLFFDLASGARRDGDGDEATTGENEAARAHAAIASLSRGKWISTNTSEPSFTKRCARSRWTISWQTRSRCPRTFPVPWSASKPARRVRSSCSGTAELQEDPGVDVR